MKTGIGTFIFHAVLLGIVLAVIIGVGVLGSGGWYLSENGLPEMPTEPSHDYDDQTVALDIERAFRTKGLISLLERKIGQNERALSQASKSNDQVISDTMRLALAKNLEDLDKHQKAYIETLVALDEAHAADADRLKAALKETLAAKDSSYKVGQAETIREIVDVLENKPVDKPFRDYLTSRFRPQKEQDLENNG